MVPLVLFRIVVVVTTGAIFRLVTSRLFRNGEKLRRVFMERSLERESVILVTPLVFKEEFAVLTHIQLLSHHVLTSLPLCPRWQHH